MSNMMNNVRTRELANLLRVISVSRSFRGITMGMGSVLARGVPVGLDAAWITLNRAAAYGDPRGRARWLSRDVWRSIAKGSGLARVSPCPTIPSYWAGFQLQLPRLSLLLTWKTVRRAKEELEHAGCSACDGIVEEVMGLGALGGKGAFVGLGGHSESGLTQDVHRVPFSAGPT
ncbi:hypothetical protein AB0O57_29075 [Streptomyces sp. NPDC091201]|uniref:hypothetical protein n=1 Tax=Streptomyces sp. NPDC091201 TaxID=3155190 RepID=UPI003444AA82